MSMKINAGEIGRQDVYLINPDQIVSGSNTRWLDHDETDVALLVKSFEDEGQLQPCVGRRVADNKVELVAGYRRWLAAKQYNLLHPNQPMKLAVRVQIMNDEEALRRSIAENKERTGTSPMDDAVSQRRLREEHGWTDTRIAEFYKVSPPYVGTLKKLLMLPRDIQLMVHSRQLSVQAAVAMADLTAEEQKAIVTPVAPATPDIPVAPVTSATVIKRTREKKIEKGKKQARTLKEVKDFLEGLPSEAPGIKAFAETFLRFIQGAYTDTTMQKKLKGFIVGVPDEPPAGLEATMVPEVPSVLTTPVESGEDTNVVSEVVPFPIETEATVPEIVPFPVETETGPFPVVEAA